MDSSVPPEIWYHTLTFINDAYNQYNARQVCADWYGFLSRHEPSKWTSQEVIRQVVAHNYDPHFLQIAIMDRESCRAENLACVFAKLIAFEAIRSGNLQYLEWSRRWWKPTDSVIIYWCLKFGRLQPLEDEKLRGAMLHTPLPTTSTWMQKYAQFQYCDGLISDVHWIVPTSNIVDLGIHATNYVAYLIGQAQVDELKKISSDLLNSVSDPKRHIYDRTVTVELLEWFAVTYTGSVPFGSNSVDHIYGSGKLEIVQWIERERSQLHPTIWMQDIISRSVINQRSMAGPEFLRQKYRISDGKWYEYLELAAYRIAQTGVLGRVESRGDIPELEIILREIPSPTPELRRDLLKYAAKSAKYNAVVWLYHRGIGETKYNHAEIDLPKYPSPKEIIEYRRVIKFLESHQLLVH
jgi:hypothetical protein